MGLEARITICNMSFEAGARAGIIAPDETTVEYLDGGPRAPQGDAWNAAVERWMALQTDDGARFDKSVEVNGGALEPMVTFGTNPGMVIPVTDVVPATGDANFHKAMDYMQLTPGKPISESPVDVVFVGSCTNSRISDLTQAADVIRGHRVAEGVRMLVVPGSQQVKKEAEQIGLDRVFIEAGAEWRESGCSMCLGMNGDTVPTGKLSVSTSNRNFEGRQGIGARTILASPMTAAASAVAGRVADPRPYLESR